MAIQKNTVIKAEDIVTYIKDKVNSYVSDADNGRGSIRYNDISYSYPPYTWSANGKSEILRDVDEHCKKFSADNTAGVIRISDVYNLLINCMFETTRCCRQSGYVIGVNTLSTAKINEYSVRGVIDKHWPTTSRITAKGYNGTQNANNSPIKSQTNYGDIHPAVKANTQLLGSDDINAYKNYVTSNYGSASQKFPKEHTIIYNSVTSNISSFVNWHASCEPTYYWGALNRYTCYSSCHSQCHDSSRSRR